MEVCPHNPHPLLVLQEKWQKEQHLLYNKVLYNMRCHSLPFNSRAFLGRIDGHLQIHHLTKKPTGFSRGVRETKG